MLPPLEAGRASTNSILEPPEETGPADTLLLNPEDSF